MTTPITLPLAPGHQQQLAEVRAEAAALSAYITTERHHIEAVERAIVRAVIHASPEADRVNGWACEITATSLVLTPPPASSPAVSPGVVPD